MKKEIRGKILLILVVLLAVVILSLAITFSHLFTTVFTSQRLENLSNSAEQYARIIEQTPHFHPPSEKALQLGESQSLMVIDSSGNVRYQTGDMRLLEKGKSIPGQEKVLQGQRLLIKTVLSASNESVFLAGIPLGAPVRGAVFLLEPAATGDQVIQTLNKVLGFGVVGALLVALGAALIVSERMARPLIQMQEVASAIMRGDFSQKAKVSGTDELSTLGSSLNQLAAHLKILQESRAEFLSNVSHEIRTPLSYIQGYTQIVREGLAASEEERQKYLDIIQDEIGRLQGILNDLMSPVRFEEAKLEIRPTPVELVPLIKKTLHTLEPFANQKQMVLTYHGTPHLPQVYVDKDRIEQVLLNLVHNAVQYSDVGCRVDIKTRFSEEQVFVSIEDNGPGIPQQELSLIWERFYRVEKSRNRALGGTGLGLPISKQIIEAHNGQIQMTSQPGEGTLVSFVLPRYRPDRTDSQTEERL
ncbi:HAMP domain-containing sensor histidine kinase [Effusibacillus dendaii]|uniref:histidine kinase n=1 Tax=Effusibacillus dendaii TaxID=2743772 RepID=A0A7I8DDK5_9BACL|nr:HAMP domain-containing sensor histidine kinase [Effusibacillus dendaii]BCJ88293.1 hypothetical protein skT53_32780 [Effusibacillus dendaii]